MIPTNQLVILREDELDCDLATAISRVRRAPETAAARILVVAPEREHEGAAGPAPDPVAGTELPVPRLPVGPAQLGRLREVSALEPVGQRLLGLVDCLERFFAEANGALAELDEAIESRALVRVMNRARVLHDVLDWAGRVGSDLRAEAARLARGERWVDTRELLVDVARSLETFFPALRVRVGVTHTPPCQGRVPDLAEAFFAAMVLVAHRIDGRGTVRVELEETDDAILHHITGVGEPRRIHQPDLVARFRRLITQNGGRLDPDWSGPNGAGLVITLPIAP